MSGAATESARLHQHRSGQEELPTPEAWGGSWEELPKSTEWWLPGRRRADRSYSTFKVRRGGGEEIPLIQGKEQWLCFAGVAVKRYPTSKVRETQVRR